MELSTITVAELIAHLKLSKTTYYRRMKINCPEFLGTDNKRRRIFTPDEAKQIQQKIVKT